MTDERAETIRIDGRVQRVGFRVHVLRLARRHGLRGWVANVGRGVSAHVAGPAARLDAFVQALRDEAPALARVDRIERTPAALPDGDGFEIRD
jgi:hydrogenase maturation protein HypF